MLLSNKKEWHRAPTPRSLSLHCRSIYLSKKDLYISVSHELAEINSGFLVSGFCWDTDVWLEYLCPDSDLICRKKYWYQLTIKKVLK